jgi:hypothetical protein
MKLTPLIKGLITSVVMLVVTLALFYSKTRIGSPLHYSVFAIYAAGILWTALDYANSPAYTGKFSSIFGQCFRCFIVVTLVMVVFTGVFTMMHPEFAEEDSKRAREIIVAEEKKRTPQGSASFDQKVNEQVEKYKKNYTVQNIQGATFGYLMTGALFTLAAGGLIFLIKRK